MSSGGLSAKEAIALDADITRELEAQAEVRESSKDLTEFDATPPQYVTSIGRGQWPKPDPHEVRLPRAFYESKGLLSSRSHQALKPVGQRRSLGRGSVLSKYGSSSRPGLATSSMTDDTATTPRDFLTPADLEEGKVALMQRFLGAQGGPNPKPILAPGEGSLVFSSTSGSAKTTPDVRCKENFPSLLDDNVRVPVKTSRSEAGAYKKPSQKARKAAMRDEGNNQEASHEEYGGDGTPAVSGFKKLASEIRNSTRSSSGPTGRAGRGRGRGRKMTTDFHEDFYRVGDMVVVEEDEPKQQNESNVFTGPNVLQVECLPTDITQQEVVDLFALFGKVLDCNIIRDVHTKDCIGMAQVRMSSIRECEMAISTLHEQESPFPGRYPQEVSPDLLVILNNTWQKIPAME